MKSFVLDVSACMPWCCEDESTPASELLLEWAMDGSELHVPSLWIWEILNVVGVTTYDVACLDLAKRLSLPDMPCRPYKSSLGRRHRCAVTND